MMSKPLFIRVLFFGGGLGGGMEGQELVCKTGSLQFLVEDAKNYYTENSTAETLVFNIGIVSLIAVGPDMFCVL